VILGTYKKTLQLRHRRFFLQHCFLSPRLAEWKRGLITDSEKENLH